MALNIYTHRQHSSNAQPQASHIHTYPDIIRIWNDYRGVHTQCLQAMHIITNTGALLVCSTTSRRWSFTQTPWALSSRRHVSVQINDHVHGRPIDHSKCTRIRRRKTSNDYNVGKRMLTICCAHLTRVLRAWSNAIERDCSYARKWTAANTYPHICTWLGSHRTQCEINKSP